MTLASFWRRASDAVVLQIRTNEPDRRGSQSVYALDDGEPSLQYEMESGHARLCTPTFAKGEFVRKA